MVSRLIHSEPATSWQADEGQTAPRLVIKRPLDDDASAFEVPHRAIDVFAHEIDLLAWLPSFGWMDSQFAGREGEDQPAASCVYRVEAENILEEAPIRLGVAAEDDRVRAIDHVSADYLRGPEVSCAAARSALAGNDVVVYGGGEMARYRIHEDKSTVLIEVAEVGASKEKLLEAFGECQSGQCSCPTNEYDKLESIEIEPGENQIRLRLEPKPGEKLDTSQIAACLDYTTAAIAPTQERS